MIKNVKLIRNQHTYILEVLDIFDIFVFVINISMPVNYIGIDKDFNFNEFFQFTSFLRKNISHCHIYKKRSF